MWLLLLVVHGFVYCWKDTEDQGYLISKLRLGWWRNQNPPVSKNVVPVLPRHKVFHKTARGWGSLSSMEGDCLRRKALNRFPSLSLQFLIFPCKSLYFSYIFNVCWLPALSQTVLDSLAEDNLGSFTHRTVLWLNSSSCITVCYKWIVTITPPFHFQMHPIQMRIVVTQEKDVKFFILSLHSFG